MGLGGEAMPRPPGRNQTTFSRRSAGALTLGSGGGQAAPPGAALASPEAVAPLDTRCAGWAQTFEEAAWQEAPAEGARCEEGAQRHASDAQIAMRERGRSPRGSVWGLGQVDSGVRDGRGHTSRAQPPRAGRSR